MKALTVQKPSGRHWNPFRRASWKPVFVQDFLFTDHFPHRAPPGDAYRISAAVQLPDLHGQGYLSGSQHHRNGNVHGNPANRCPYLPSLLLLYLEVGLIYLIFSTVLTKLQAVGEKKLGSYGQKGV